MGDPKKPKRKFETPKKMWDKARVERRRELTELYGLKNKKEIWRAETILRKKRQTARKLLALSSEERKKREKELLESLEVLGVLKKNSSLDDVLSLKVESLLDQRLQSIVVRNGLAATMKQARQLITHGHITVNGQKVNTPSYLVKKTEESKIGFRNPALGLKIKKAMREKKEDKRENKKIAEKPATSAESPNKKEVEKKEKPGKDNKKEREAPVEKKEKSSKKEEKPGKEKDKKNKKEKENNEKVKTSE